MCSLPQIELIDIDKNLLFRAKNIKEGPWRVNAEEVRAAHQDLARGGPPGRRLGEVPGGVKERSPFCGHFPLDMQERFPYWKRNFSDNPYLRCKRPKERHPMANVLMAEDNELPAGIATLPGSSGGQGHV